MARDINFTRISRRDLVEKREIVKSAIENKNFGIVDKNVDRKDIVQITDNVFFNRVMINFESNQDANSCFINDFKDRLDSDFSKSYNVQLDPVNTCLKIIDKQTYGEYYTREIFSNESADSTMNKFYLVVDQDVPKSSSVKYYIVTDKDEVFPIKANNKEALEIKAKENLPSSVRIKAYIQQGAGEMQVKIRGIALLYEDAYTKSQMDIYIPDFEKEIVQTPEDIVTLFRDPNNDDTLFKVESSTEKIMINYDELSGELISLGIYDIQTDRLKSDIDMIYEDYTNSNGVTEKVLTKIRTRHSTTGVKVKLWLKEKQVQ